jgi:putative mRNA 3-end processing factor
MEPLLRLTDRGLYCPAGDFFVDPWRPVDRAVITHAHSDHARPGHRCYLAASHGLSVLRARIGADAEVLPLAYGESLDIDGVRLSLHPAGHILGSAQVRLEHLGQVAVVSGDYKTTPDDTCASFEPLRCHLFITESTFGLPVYQWPAQATVFGQINAWWRAAAETGKTCLLFAYSLGKAQRLLSGLDPTIGPIFCHGAVENLNRAYREAGVSLPPTAHAGPASNRSKWARAIVLAPPSAHGTPWARKFEPATTAFASGWMTIRGKRRRQALDRGFILSDHADWAGLLQAVSATGAERVWVTHGYMSVLVRHLRENGIDAEVLPTQFAGETEDSPELEPETLPEAGGAPEP